MEEKKGTKFEIEKQMKGAKEERKKTKEEDEPFWALLGAPSNSMNFQKYPSFKK